MPPRRSTRGAKKEPAAEDVIQVKDEPDEVTFVGEQPPPPAPAAKKSPAKGRGKGKAKAEQIDQPLTAEQAAMPPPTTTTPGVSSASAAPAAPAPAPAPAPVPAPLPEPAAPAEEAAAPALVVPVTGTSAILSRLTPSQLRAATYPADGVLQILAGPGSGKTATLTARVAWLISPREDSELGAGNVLPGIASSAGDAAARAFTPPGLRPEDVVVVTFTKKAATEMTERLHAMLGAGRVKELKRMGTLHSVSMRLLKGNVKHLPKGRLQSDRFSLLDTEDSKRVVKGLIEAKYPKKSKGNAAAGPGFRFSGRDEEAEDLDLAAALGDDDEDDNDGIDPDEEEAMYGTASKSKSQAQVEERADDREIFGECERLDERKTMNKISSWKSRRISPAQAMAEAEKELAEKRAAIARSGGGGGWIDKKKDVDPVEKARLEARAIARIFALYEKRKFDMDAADYDDLILYAVELLENRPQLAQRIQHGEFLITVRFQTSWNGPVSDAHKRRLHTMHSAPREVLVDEFQDTSALQYQLVKLFAQCCQALTTVGDPDQSIYGWRNADKTNLLLMQNDFKHVSAVRVDGELLTVGAKAEASKQGEGAGQKAPRGVAIINLEENFRSTGSIIHSATEIIRQDSTRIERSQRPVHPTGEKTSLLIFEDQFKEADGVAEEIKRLSLLSAGVLSYNDFAILVRTNAATRSFESALNTARIDYRIVGGVKFWDRQEIKDVLSYFALAENPNHQLAFDRALRSPKRSIGPALIQDMHQEARRRGISTMAYCERFVDGALEAPRGMGASRVSAMREFVAIIQGIRQRLAHGKWLHTTIKWMLRESQYADALEGKMSQAEQEKLNSRKENLVELITVAATMEGALKTDKKSAGEEAGEDFSSSQRQQHSDSDHGGPDMDLDEQLRFTQSEDPPSQEARSSQQAGPPSSLPPLFGDRSAPPPPGAPPPPQRYSKQAGKSQRSVIELIWGVGVDGFEDQEEEASTSPSKSKNGKGKASDLHRYDSAWAIEEGEKDGGGQLAKLRELLLSANLIEEGGGKEDEDDEAGRKKPKVTICTVHSAKGLEWPVVFVVAAEDGKTPSFFTDKADSLLEEVRVFFVALTRAKAYLYVTAAEARTFGAKRIEAALTPFIAGGTSKQNKLPETEKSPMFQAKHDVFQATPPKLDSNAIKELAQVIARPCPRPHELKAGADEL